MRCHAHWEVRASDRWLPGPERSDEMDP
jgi:hypothetical protein